MLDVLKLKDIQVNNFVKGEEEGLSYSQKSLSTFSMNLGSFSLMTAYRF